jgi:hypothetical protein
MQHTTEATKQYQCRHIFTDGRRCASPCLSQQEFCYYHPPSLSVVLAVILSAAKDPEALHAPIPIESFTPRPFAVSQVLLSHPFNNYP